MRRAIALAMRGRGDVEPNPMVGCVIVRDGRIIGEGWHRQFGGPHAEREALAAFAESPRGATAYVTLEPCCHLDKKTPPCVPALLEAGIARVVVGCGDPNPKVSGRGLEQLRQAGVAVETGLLGDQCRQLIAPFIATTLHRRPYVTLKWAQSADGLMAGRGGRRMQITGDAATHAVHELRSRCDAILVGIGTVLADDPLLTTRGVEHPRRLVRVVADSRLRIGLASRLVQTAPEVPLIIAHAPGANEAARRALESAGARLLEVPEESPGRLSLPDLLRSLLTLAAAPRCTHLLVEPGPTLARRFLETGLADRVWILRSPGPIDEPDAPQAPDVSYLVTGSANIGGDELTEYLNPKSDVFAAMEPSADLLTARQNL